MRIVNSIAAFLMMLGLAAWHHLGAKSVRCFADDCLRFVGDRRVANCVHCLATSPGQSGQRARTKQRRKRAELSPECFGAAETGAGRLRHSGL